jgi:hypothetical protein
MNQLPKFDQYSYTAHSSAPCNTATCVLLRFYWCPWCAYNEYMPWFLFSEHRMRRIISTAGAMFGVLVPRDHLRWTPHPHKGSMAGSHRVPSIMAYHVCLAHSIAGKITIVVVEGACVWKLFFTGLQKGCVWYMKPTTRVIWLETRVLEVWAERLRVAAWLRYARRVRETTRGSLPILCEAWWV